MTAHRRPPRVALRILRSLNVHQTRTEDKGGSGISPLVAASFGRPVPLAEESYPTWRVSPGGWPAIETGIAREELLDALAAIQDPLPGGAA